MQQFELYTGAELRVHFLRKRVRKFIGHLRVAPERVSFRDHAPYYGGHENPSWTECGWRTARNIPYICVFEKLFPKGRWPKYWGVSTPTLQGATALVVLAGDIYDDISRRSNKFGLTKIACIGSSSRMYTFIKTARFVGSPSQAPMLQNIHTGKNVGKRITTKYSPVNAIKKAGYYSYK